MNKWSSLAQIKSKSSGALIIEGAEEDLASTYTATRDEFFGLGSSYHATVCDVELEDGDTAYAAIFPNIPQGTYQVTRSRRATPGMGFWEAVDQAFEDVLGKKVTVFPGQMTRMRWE
jgi:hypothetical protein